MFNGASELNSETENYETFYRPYDPTVGRFTGVDPLASYFTSWNPYQYAFNDPVFYNDPNGDCSVCNQHTLFESNDIGVGKWGRGNFEGPGNGDGGKKNESKDNHNYVISGLAFAWEMFVGDTFTPGAGRVVGVSDSSNDPEEPQKTNPNESFLSENKPDFYDRWSRSDNWFKELTYEIVDGVYVTGQFWRLPSNRYHLDGQATVGSDNTDAFVVTLGLVFNPVKSTTTVKTTAKSVTTVIKQQSKLTALTQSEKLAVQGGTNWPWEKLILSADELRYASCDKCAKAIQKLIGGNIFKVSNPLGLKLGPVKIGNGTVSEWFYHVAVKKGDMIFDRITGPKGMHIDDYKKLFDYADDLIFETLD